MYDDELWRRKELVQAALEKVRINDLDLTVHQLHMIMRVMDIGYGVGASDRMLEIEEVERLLKGRELL